MWWWCLKTTHLLKSASPSTRWERSSDLSLSTTMFFVILLRNPDISTISNSYEETISPKREKKKGLLCNLTLLVCSIEKWSDLKVSDRFLFVCLWCSGRPIGGESAPSKQGRRTTYPTATSQKCTMGASS